jgi:hypothetical protein
VAVHMLEQAGKSCADFGISFTPEQRKQKDGIWMRE